jgi:hypothetical protein
MRALLVAALLALAAPAHADPPAPAVAGPQSQAGEHLYVKRETLELIMAEAATAEPTRQLLLRCQADVERAAKKNAPAPGWYTAVKWAGVGGAIAGAFLLGMTLGR